VREKERGRKVKGATFIAKTKKGERGEQRV